MAGGGAASGSRIWAVAVFVFFFALPPLSLIAFAHAINKNSIDSLGYAEACVENKIEVRCLSLDDLIDELDIVGQSIDLLKIDAQGGEVDILLGDKKTLQHVRNITLELSLFDFYSKKNTFLEIEELLDGFELYSITKLSQNPMNFRTDWAELFYRKNAYYLNYIKSK